MLWFVRSGETDTLNCNVYRRANLENFEGSDRRSDGFNRLHSERLCVIFYLSSKRWPLGHLEVFCI